MLKRKLLVILVVLLSLLAVVSTTVIAIISNKTTQTAVVEKDILSKIAQNNPGFFQSSNSYSSGAEASALSRDAAASSSTLIAPGIPFNQDFKYYYSKSTTTRGPAFNSCNYGIDQSQIVFVPVYESFNYNDGTDYYSKYVGYNTDESVNTYSLSVSTTLDNTFKYENTTYFGGSYAVRTINENTYNPTTAEPMPVDLPTTLENESSVSTDAPATTVTTDDFSSYFGENSSLLRTETINGKDYYVVQNFYDVNCAGYVNRNRWETDTVADNRTMYVLTYADADTYQILKSENYLDSVSDSNLIQRTETINANSDIDFASVSSNFVFTYNVPVKDIDLSDSTSSVSTYSADEEVQKALNFAKQQNISVVTPTTSANGAYVYLYSTALTAAVIDTTSYYSDRNFYPAGSIGDQMYNSYNGIGDLYNVDSYPVSLGTVSYVKDDLSYSLNIYSSSEDEKVILNSLLWSDLRNKSETPTTVTINGESVAATLYSFEIDQPDVTILPYTDSLRVMGGSGSETEGCASDCFKKQYIVIFTYKNNKYTLQEYNYGTGTELEYTVLEDGTFNGYSADNQDDLVQIETLLNNSIKGNSVDGSSGLEVVPPSEPLKY